MRLDELTSTQQTILSVLYQAPNGRTRLEIKNELNGSSIPEGAISSVLNRLEVYGFLEKPELGRPWKLSAQGQQLFQPKSTPEPEPESTPEPESAPEREPEPEPESESEPESEPESFRHDLSKQLQHMMEIEVALDQVQTQLRIPHIPAQASKIYLRILEALPPILVEALAPITTFIKSWQS